MGGRDHDEEAQTLALRRPWYVGGHVPGLDDSGVTKASAFELHSPDVGQRLDKTQEYHGYGCTGPNVSPALSWSGAPAGTKSYAITLFDPDAPTGHGWWHWIVTNLPEDVHALPTGASGRKMPPGAVETRTDFGQPGYGGPCPPKGDKAHHYVFTIHALDVARLDVKPDLPPNQVLPLIKKHTLATATFTALYQR